MMKKTILSTVIPLVMIAQAQGTEFNLGEVEGSFDSQLSLGSSWRVESRDEAMLSGVNGESTNNDDGNKNYASGDAFSQIFKGSHDLQFSYQNYGGFVRGKYWYDSALANNSVDYGHGPTVDVGGLTGTALTYSGNEKLDDSDFNDLSKASGAALLDAFVYGEFEIMDMPLDMRLGRQVVSWGEGTFISGGVNAINPVDINAFQRPGAEIKEALLPVNMAYANMGLTDDLSVESFYQFEFESHALPGCGTYFSFVDAFSKGCNNITVLDGNASVSRAEDDGVRLAKDDGQFGLAFRYNASSLGDTEFGLYFMNVHNRVPVMSIIKNNVNEELIGQTAGANYFSAGQAAIQASVQSGDLVLGSPAYMQALQQLQTSATTAGLLAGGAAMVDSSSYFTSYVEDIQLMGLSFATNVGAMAVSGEVSHKKDVPLGINGPMLISALLGGNVNDDVEGNENELDLLVANAEEGAELDGFRLFDVSQIQLTAINVFDQVAGASRISFVAEAGMTYVHDFDESADAIKFGRGGVYGHPADANASGNDGFVTTSSWGYRAQIRADYTNVFSGVNLLPVLSWRHDVKGYAPQPGGVFQEGQQALGLSLEASYLSTYSAEISYTQFMGGDYSLINDRDFASISVGVQF